MTGASAGAANIGRVFDIQRFSVHDGPGVRTTVFLKGCPLRCAWCQNPESMTPEPQLLLYEERCIECGACAQTCPLGFGAAKRDGAPAGRPLDECPVCGACANVCPTEARRIAGGEMTVDDAVAAALRDWPFYGERGGVTFGGGEPLMQWAFVRACAERLRGEGVHVAVDTCGLAAPAIIDEAPQVVDLLMVDLKLSHAERHKHWTGAGNDRIQAAIRRWSETATGRLWLSVPLVPGVHDPEELEQMAHFITSLPSPPPVRLLPYHRLGESKRAALGLPLPDFDGDVDELLRRARDVMTAAGIELLLVD